MSTAAVRETAVAVLVFNRADLTKRLFSALSLIKPTRLYIVSDGPRANKPEDEIAIEEVRKEIERSITWNCSVHKNYSNTNLGCRDRVISGITWVFEHEKEAIILEDDCIPCSAFFDFCANSLHAYRADLRVGMISGWSFLNRRSSKKQVYYSRWSHIWGWATWRDRWHQYDAQFTAWSKIVPKSEALGWMTDEQIKYWSDAFAKVRSGELNTWDYQWQALFFAKNWYCLTPLWSLIENQGFVGPTGTHTKNHGILFRRSTNVLPAVDQVHDLFHSDALSRKVWRTGIDISILYRILWKLKLNRILTFLRR